MGVQNAFLKKKTESPPISKILAKRKSKRFLLYLCDWKSTSGGAAGVHPMSNY